MSQLSFDEATTTAQLSLGEIAATRPSPGRADPTRRPLTDEQELAVERRSEPLLLAAGAGGGETAGPGGRERPVEARSEPLLLAAGAGSGKTSVLVERFVRAVREDGVAPGRILA